MNQNQELLARLKQGPVTPLDALGELGIYRLSARILELRDQGHDIQTELVKANGKRFAKYRLIKS